MSRNEYALFSGAYSPGIDAARGFAKKQLPAKRAPPGQPGAFSLRSCFFWIVRCLAAAATTLHGRMNLTRLTVQLVVHLRLFLRGQLAAVGLEVVAHCIVDPRLALFQLDGLLGAQRAALHALRDAVLLIFFPLLRGLDGSRLRRRG